jgi:8-oxo-dGTP pyrophosphatase MutT (NUDIX family)
MPDKSEIGDAVLEYWYGHADEADRLRPLFAALLVRDDDVRSRKMYPLHVTCSAAAVRPDGQVLEIFHRRHREWLFPGGHIDAEDETLAATALRELAEETGVVAARTADLGPFDIHMHHVAANPDKNEPAHQHADFVYAVLLDIDPEVTLKTDEVVYYRWVVPRHSYLRALRLLRKAG